MSGEGPPTTLDPPPPWHHARAVDRSLGLAGLFFQPAKDLRKLSLRFRDVAF